MNHPDELIAQLRIIGRLEEFGSGARFARRFQGAGAEERIHWHLRRTCFVRRAQGATCCRSCRPSARSSCRSRSTTSAEYRLAEEDVIAWLREQPLDLARARGKVAAALRAERLAQLNVLRRLAARGKLGRGAGLDRGLPGLRRAARRLLRPPRGAGAGCSSASRTRCTSSGSDSMARREEAVQAFQAPDGPQLIVCRDARRRPGHHARRAPPTSPSSTSSGRRRCTTRPRTAATASASTTP